MKKCDILGIIILFFLIIVLIIYGIICMGREIKWDCAKCKNICTKTTIIVCTSENSDLCSINGLIRNCNEFSNFLKKCVVINSCEWYLK